MDDDLLGLLILAKKNLKGVQVIIREHPLATLEAEGDLKDLGVSSHLGKNQILFKKEGRIVSCIRAAHTHGFYEIWGIKNLPEIAPERFDNIKDVIKRVRAMLFNPKPL